MPRREQKTEKKSTPTPPSKKGRVNTKAAQRRHERNVAKAKADRDAKIMYGDSSVRFIAHAQRDKIEKKAATRRKLASMTPAQRAERRAAGREHRKPRT